jgi:hypothetical protein
VRCFQWATHPRKIITKFKSVIRAKGYVRKKKKKKKIAGVGER